MPAPAEPTLTQGRVYRARDLRPWGSNTTRLAKRLVREGRLRQLRHGVYEAAVETRFGPAPADDHVLVRAFLGTDDFLFTGSAFWNALGLGASGVRAVALVYNQKRTGEFEFGNRRFEFRRVAYPSSSPPTEWFVIDLLRHHSTAGVDRDELLSAMVVAVRNGRFDGGLLRKMAVQFGRAGTVAAVDEVLVRAGRSS